MLRFTPPRHRLPRTPRWPDFTPRDPRTPFSRRPPLELLTVVADAELLDALRADDPPNPDLLLGGLLTAESVRLLRYSDAGPKKGQSR